MRASGFFRIPVILATVIAMLAVTASSAFAAEEVPGTGWELTARTYPTYLLPGGRGMFEIDVFNIGAANSSGAITVTDTLPPGVTARDVEVEGESHPGAGELTNGGLGEGVSPAIGNNFWDCTGNAPGSAVEGATVVTCTNTAALTTIPGGGGEPNRVTSHHLDPEIAIAVNAPSGEASGLTNRVTIAGGGAATPATSADPVTVSSNAPHFGFVGFDGWFSNADGTIATRAGSHPYEATFSLDLATRLNPEKQVLEWPAGGEPRNISLSFPPGFVGNPTAVAQCTRQQLNAKACPESSVVGIQTITFRETGNVREALYNMVPPQGVPAEFASFAESIDTFYDVTVRSGGDYGLTTHIDNISQREVMHVDTTLWGEPNSKTYDRWRNKTGPEGCDASEEEIDAGACSLGEHPVLTPFLTLPTSCEGPQKFSIFASSWENPAITSRDEFATHDTNGAETGFTGCEGLAFGPTITTSPDTSDADSTAGLTVEVTPPLGGLEDPEGLGTADIKETNVTLPAGFVINPGQAAGLKACQVSESAIGTENAPSCSLASKVGTIKAKTPLLEGAAEKELEGNIFVLQSNPPNLQVLAALSADGINVKLVLNVHLDEATGQVTTTVASGIPQFPHIPPFPVSAFKLSFEGGAKAALVTPATCGTYNTTADFTPWSSPFGSDFHAGAAFGVTAGVGGGACPSGPLPFSPSMTAGSTSDFAGGFTSFSLLLQRADGQQRIEKFQFKEPAGMAGMLSQVPLCPEPQASQGACDEGSKIGHAIVQSGPGNNPLTLPQPGGPELPIYLTGPYKGAPFGLSIVTPIVGGPFNLGTIITRAKIDVDPNTAQITITTDPLPQIVKGVPTDIRSIYSVIDRPNFLFNPTNCNLQEFKGTATSAGGAAVAPISSHFGIGACKALKFAPKFSASTSAKTSKANGASLHVKIAYPNEPQGSEANIAKVALTIPAILPTRLTTIQKACTEAQFNANPAGCPAASVIATAIVHTPVLKSPLTGPAYFVSHGGAAFPDVELILQGEGVTLIVDGKTQIKKGVTFSHFETVPDAPFSSFEFIAPQGPFSIFTANGNLCASEVKMPTTLTAQNGAVLTQSTPVEVQGCPNGLKILSHSIRKRTLTIKVIVPAAGKLTASGKGLSKSSKSSKGRSTLTLTIKAKKGGRLRTKVKLSFAPTKGHKLAATVAARFKR